MKKEINKNLFIILGVVLVIVLVFTLSNSINSKTGYSIIDGGSINEFPTEPLDECKEDKNCRSDKDDGNNKIYCVFVPSENRKMCVECKEDEHCSFPTPICHKEKFMCVQCMTDNDCDIDNPIIGNPFTCDQQNNVCVCKKYGEIEIIEIDGIPEWYSDKQKDEFILEQIGNRVYGACTIVIRDKEKVLCKVNVCLFRVTISWVHGG